jgi:hypothetical protein
MSHGETFDATQPVVPPPPRSSRRLWLGLGIGCGLALLLCCGGFTALTFLTGTMFANAFSQDPQVVRERTAEICTIDLPPEFQPSSSFDLVIPVKNQRFLTWVAYTGPSHAGSPNLIVLGQFYQQLAEATRDQLMEQIHQSIRQQQEHEHVRIDDSKTFTREFTIRGEKAEFLFQEGEGDQSKARFRIVVGQFKGSGGTALLYLQVNPEQFDDDALVKIIESIR